ncbi:hypothetical protein COB64_04305 [Candidatus Wolfebacteria bacterium]|nr:MAG: hypothetical protein COB64_04305 [Candidatus Wolfebacteria bacterium]
MKTHSKNRVYSYQDPALDKRILNTSTHTKHEAKLDGMFTAVRLIPAATGDKYSSLVGSIVGVYNELLAYANKVIQGSLNGYQGANDRNRVEERKKKLDTRINAIWEEVGLKRMDLVRLVLTYPWKKRKYIVVGIVAISGVEAVMAAQSFQLFVTNLILSILVAILVWGALIAVAHILPKIIRKGETVAQQLLIGIGCLAILSTVFYILGEFRVEYLTRLSEFAEASGAGSDNSIFGISSVSFMVLNLFFLSISTLLSYFYLPNSKQRQEKEAWDNLNDEINDLTGKIEKLNAEKQTIDDEFSFSQEKRAAIIAYAKYSEVWIKTLYENSIQAFQKENILKRSDKQIPDCFDQDPPELNYYYNNINL